jgi:TrmH family RNA methyltransferase
MKAVVAASSQVISSAANPLLKEVRRALRQGVATSDGCVVVDSFHLLEEALRSGRECEMVLASEDARSRVLKILASHDRTPVRFVENALFDRIAPSETPQGVLALVRPPCWTLDDLFRRQPLVVILDGVQDPGNAGAIARAVEAFGGTGVVFVRDTAGPFNPKTLRASAGSLFRLPYVAGVGRDLTRQELRRRNVQVIAASSESGSPPDRLDWRAPTALVIGSEAHGVSLPLREEAKSVRIPTSEVESLNAAVAAAVLLYEASRQRAGSDLTVGAKSVAGGVTRAARDGRGKGRR